MMLEVDNGNHASVPGVDLFPVSAVKIQVNYAQLINYNNFLLYLVKVHGSAKYKV
jgi:hypothetical protein